MCSTMVNYISINSLNMLYRLTLVFYIFNCIFCHTIRSMNYYDAIKKSERYIEQIRKNYTIPGMVAGVSVDYTTAWAQGFGEIDLENNVKTDTDSVFRLGSISKTLTTVLVAKLIDEGKLRLNDSVYHYLTRDVFPIKKWNNKTVDITLCK